MSYSAKIDLIFLSAFMALATLACEHTIIEPGISEAEKQKQLISETLAPPEDCAVCHPNHYAQWQQSMHAYAIDDPIFQTLSKIGQERSNHELDQYCLKCHTPIGSLAGETQPGFSFDNLSPLAGAGISCDVCHTLKEIRHGEGASSFYLDGTRRGPIIDPTPNGFHKSEFSARYQGSFICSSCHQVKSPDKSFDVETTSLEWSLSPYVLPAIECQTCHMPTYSGQAAVGGPEREKLHLHTFVGVDYPLIDFPGKEETIASVGELLENAVVMEVETPTLIAQGEPLKISVVIKNKFTGHNVPSGAIFERQMWLEVTLLNQNTGDLVFSTGLLDGNGDLMNEHSEFVTSGEITKDHSLVLYNGKTIDENGDETLFFWEASSVENNTIPAFESRTSAFEIPVPSGLSGLELRVRLRFRSFPPYVFRKIDKEDLVSELRIFDMETFQQTITVVQ